MFLTLILVVHIVVCLALIMIILLQTGKGADIGAVFGGGSSQTVFGSTGATPFLSKLTIGAAVIFMVTSIVLTYFSGQGAGITKDSSIMDIQGSGAPAGVPLESPGTPPADTGAGKPEAGPGGSGPQAPAGAPSAPATNVPNQGAGSSTAPPPGGAPGDK